MKHLRALNNKARRIEQIVDAAEEDVVALQQNQPPRSKSVV